MPSLVKGLFVFFFLFFAANAIFASDNLLLNSDFDDWDNSGPIDWQKSASSNFLIENASGAALLRLTTSNYRYLYQIASVSGSTAYRLSGLIKNISGSASAFLRLAWYCQGCPSQLSTDDSNSVEAISGGFSESFLEVTSPATSALARVRVMIIPQNGFTGSQILVDKIFLGLATISSSSTSSNVSGPQIDWNLDSEFKLGEQFNARVSLANFDAATEYYLKLRGGLEETALNKVQTKNGDNFYGDTENWGKFLLIKTNQSGAWSGEISGLVDIDKPEGLYKIRLRVHKKDTDSSYDSGLRSVKFVVPPKVDLATSLTPIYEPEATASTQAGTEEILGTSSAFLFDDLQASSPTAEVKKVQSTTLSRNTDGLALIFIGLTSVGLACLPVFRKIRLWWHKRYNK